MLVFLKEASYPENDHACWILGSYTTVLFASHDDSGKLYYMEHFGHLKKSMDSSVNQLFDQSLYA